MEIISCHPSSLSLPLPPSFFLLSPPTSYWQGMARDDPSLHICASKGRLEKEDPYVSSLQGAAFANCQLEANQLPYSGGVCQSLCLRTFVVSTKLKLKINHATTRLSILGCEITHDSIFPPSLPPSLPLPPFPHLPSLPPG